MPETGNELKKEFLSKKNLKIWKFSACPTEEERGGGAGAGGGGGRGGERGRGEEEGEEGEEKDEEEERKKMRECVLRRTLRCDLVTTG